MTYYFLQLKNSQLFLKEKNVTVCYVIYESVSEVLFQRTNKKLNNLLKNLLKLVHLNFININFYIHFIVYSTLEKVVSSLIAENNKSHTICCFITKGTFYN